MFNNENFNNKSNGRGRNWRRKQSVNKKMKAFKRLYNTDSPLFFAGDFRERCLDRANRYKDNMTLCSCHMCGNPRKYSKDLTIQEKKANDIFNSQDLD